MNDIIKQELKVKNLSVVEFAKLLGMSHTQVYRLLKNKHIGNKSIRALAKYFNLSIEEVVLKIDNKQL